MRLLIAQGPGYYGVNARMITEITARKIAAVVGKPLPIEASDAMIWMTVNAEGNATTLVVTALLEGNTSAGFDTGWWEEGEKELDEIIREARKWSRS